MADEGTIVTRESGQTGYPRGTRAEIMAKGLDPRVVPTCSQRIEGINAGCPYFNSNTMQCIFSHVRNAEAGPVNIGFYKRIGKPTDPNKVEQGFVMPCYLFMGNEFEIWTQQHKSHGNFSISRFLNEGDAIVHRVHVPRHPKVDPECHRCRQGSCNLTDFRDVPGIVEPFRRPDEAIPDTLFPEPGAEDVSHFDLAQKAIADPKTGTQLEELVAKRREARKITERASGSPGT